MSAQWIPVRVNLRQDPHVLRLARALNVPRVAAMGALVALWQIADDQTTDGVLRGWDDAAIDEEIGLPGLCAALRAGIDGKGADPWLIDAPEGDGHPAIPDFDRHMSKSAKTRATDRRRKDHERAATSNNGHAGETASEPARTQPARPTPKPVRVLSESDRTESGQKPDYRTEQKRREETPPVSASALTSPPASPVGSAPDPAEPVEFALVPDNGQANGTLLGIADPPESRMKPPTKPKPRAPGFDGFYAVYPRKVGIDAAERAFVRAVGKVRARDPTQTAETAAARLAERAGAFASSEVGRGPQEFIPHPATWLNEGRFDDDDSAWTRGDREQRHGGGDSATTARARRARDRDREFGADAGAVGATDAVQSRGRARIPSA